MKYCSAPPDGVTLAPAADFSLDNIHPDETSLSSDLKQVLKQLETFKKNNSIVGLNKKLKSTFDEIDSL